MSTMEIETSPAVADNEQQVLQNEPASLAESISEFPGDFTQDLKLLVANKDMDAVLKYVTVYDVLLRQYPSMKLCDQRTIDGARNLIEKLSVASARESKKRTAVDNSALDSKKKSKKGKNAAEGDDIGEIEKDDNEWICAVCDQLKSVDGTDLLLCDGGCLRSFHTGCIGISSKVPEGDWFCEQCSNNSHSCFICNEENSVDKPVKKCQKAKCGRYYHRRCVTDHHKHYAERIFLKRPEDLTSSVVDIAAAEVGSPSQRTRKPSMKVAEATADAADAAAATTTTGDEEGEGEEDFSITCPSHFCQVCYDVYGNKQRQLLHRCIYCPKAYHLNCIEPGSRFNSMCVICPDHPEKQLPTLDEVDNVSISDNKATTDPNNIWDQITFFDTEPLVENIFDGHFLLPQALKTEVVYKEISKLDFDSFPGGEKALPYHETDEVCECSNKPPVLVDGQEVRQCGPGCLNRMLQIECYDNKSKSRAVNCNGGNCSIGGDCGNRQIQQRKYAKVQPFMEFERGWGLRVVEPVQKGKLVIEYIGEVIDQQTTTKRMSDQRRFTPNDHDFYVMQLENGVFVDGKFKGNHSRFINHSCDPNCELVPTLVRGRMRIGIFAIKDIPKDTALSYDYQFETSEAQVFKCCCGAINCRGTMAPVTKTERNRQKYLKMTTNKIDKVDRKRMIEVRLLLSLLLLLFVFYIICSTTTSVYVYL